MTKEVAAPGMHYMYYNFRRFHETLRVIHEAGVSGHVCTVEDIAACANCRLHLKVRHYPAER